MTRDEQAIKRLRWMRAATVAAPWVTLVAFAGFRMYGGAEPPLDPFPAADRDSFTVFWLGSGAVSVIAWVVARVSLSPNAATWAAQGCYPLAMWVALFGAAAAGRGAGFTWFLLPYLWALAVVYALFPISE
jgi:hypothetical protein